MFSSFIPKLCIIIITTSLSSHPPNDAHKSMIYNSTLKRQTEFDVVAYHIIIMNADPSQSPIRTAISPNHPRLPQQRIVTYLSTCVLSSLLNSDQQFIFVCVNISVYVCFMGCNVDYHGPFRISRSEGYTDLLNECPSLLGNIIIKRNKLNMYEIGCWLFFIFISAYFCIIQLHIH